MSRLPQLLDQFGFSGCTQYASAEFSAMLQNNGGSATWQLAIPSDPSLLGLPFYVQGLVLDFGVNPGNAIVTNAGEGLVGGR